MSSDEDDYMSDKFLAGCAENVRPGLIKTKSKQREVEVETKRRKFDEQRKEQKKPNERERLQEGLSNAITSENKGFALLAKMGYKEGQSLGKTSTGIVVPIGIHVKSDRGGLGRDAAIRDLQIRKQAIRQKRLESKSKGIEITTEEFRKRITQKAEEKQMESALRKCQSACERLDEKDDVEEPALSWFWPERTSKTEDEVEEEIQDEDDIQYETFEKLEMITDYLRTTYNYCHWCGVHYDDLNDLKDNCPGPTKDDH